MIVRVLQVLLVLCLSVILHHLFSEHLVRAESLSFVISRCQCKGDYCTLAAERQPI